MKNRLLILLVACFVLAGGAQATTIFSRTGILLPSPGTEIGSDSDQMLATSWSQNFFSANTQITGLGIEMVTDGATAVHFELRSGAPDGALITFSDVALNASLNYILFSGLFLAPADYFVVASVTDAATSGLSANWRGMDTEQNVQLVTAPGAAVGTEYYQNLGTAGFQPFDLELGLEVNGDITTVPEPATLAFVGAGLLALGLLRRKLV